MTNSAMSDISGPVRGVETPEWPLSASAALARKGNAINHMAIVATCVRALVAVGRQPLNAIATYL